MSNLKRRNSFYRTLKNVEPDMDDFEMDRGDTAAAQNKWVFEIAWEVANKGLHFVEIISSDLQK